MHCCNSEANEEKGKKEHTVQMHLFIAFNFNPIAFKHIATQRDLLQ